MPKRQAVSFCFYKVDPTWRLRSVEERDADKRAFVEAVGRFDDEMMIRTYTTVGTRGDVDLLIWRAGEDVRQFAQAAAAVNHTGLGPFISTPYHYLAMTRPSTYVSEKHRHPGQDGTRTRVRPADAPFLVVYPFVKTHAWYALPREERQRMMDEHIEIGHKYPTVKINTTYSFGLDDQEFMVAFETEDLSDFLECVMDLRAAEQRPYTLRDTPIFTCTRMDLREALDLIG